MSDSPHNQTPEQGKVTDAPRLVNSAGPHARPELTDLEKTPGCGMLPEPGNPNAGPTG